MGKRRTYIWQGFRSAFWPTLAFWVGWYACKLGWL